MGSQPPPVACLPMKIDCLVLNDKVVNNEDVKVAPLAQPNYTFLRLDNHTMQSDVLPFTDLHYTSPVDRNRRMTDLATGKRLVHRQGVYVSWTLPRVYRTGAAAAPKAASGKQKSNNGIPTPLDPDPSAPSFRAVPTRWLVVRYLDTDSLDTASGLSAAQKDSLQFQAWVIESDRCSLLDDIPLEENGREVDLQTDYSPFIKAGTNNTKDSVGQQAEVFIGSKSDAANWTETNPTSVPLSLLNSSNHLFADYQPHNNNVFSMIDEMTYTDATGKLQKLDEATASYYVIGWHHDFSESLFDLGTDGTCSLGERLKALELVLAGATTTDGVSWEKSTTSTDTLCHGAMYGVKWTYKGLPSDDIARAAAANVASKQPVAIGSSAMESLLAFVKSHVDETTDTDLNSLENDLLSLRNQLVSQEDGVDARLKAEDQLDSTAFHSQSGGGLWHIAGDGGDAQDQSGVTINSAVVANSLRALNEMQAAIDSITRTMKYISWNLFSVWWQYVAGTTEKSADTLSQKVEVLQKRWEGLSSRRSENTTQLVKLKASVEQALVASSKSTTAQMTVKMGTYPAFSQRKDPTLFVGGVRPGWAHDYLDKLSIRIDTQIVTLKDLGLSGPLWGSSYLPFAAGLATKLPQTRPGIQAAAAALLQEFGALYQSKTTTYKDCIPPLYHDQTDSSSGWRDEWTMQPWFPLFAEWQAEYYHIPYDCFSLESRAGESQHDKVRWGLTKNTVASKYTDDLRVLSGRILMLPQTSVSLEAAVQRVISNNATGNLDSKQTDFLQNKSTYYKLPFLSSTMTGLTPHLTTRLVGAHITPNQRPNGGGITAVEGAVDVSTDIGTKEEVLGPIIGDQTGLTPYGNSVQLLTSPDDDQNSQPSPFKPVTHGQFRFTQINIMDKFGRAVSLLDPTPEQKGTLHIAPCLSELYTCQTLPAKSLPKDNATEGSSGAVTPTDTKTPDTPIPNTITHDMSTGVCEYAQIPPSINQPARLNFAFTRVDQTDQPSTQQWTPVTPVDPDPAAFGWIVMNYADYAMQFFTPDGKFYQELRFGGPSGIVETAKWTPFARPTVPQEDTKKTQLDLVIDALVDVKNPGYMQAFYRMITFALGSIKAADPSYAQYLNSIIGRPLALVNIGVSLELATSPLENESNAMNNQEYSLLGQGHPKPTQGQYKFPVQIGDKLRSYDGMLGFWDSTPLGKGQNLEQAFDYNQIYTFWPDTDKCPNMKLVQPNTVQVSPFFVPPDIADAGGTTFTPSLPQTQRQQKDANLHPICALVDPFTAVHAFSGILPTEAITLPHWSTEQALKQMTAFFHIGPILSTVDVPSYQENIKLGADTDVGTVGTAGNVGIPAVDVGSWRWLQPYYTSSASDAATSGDTELTTPVPSTNYNALGISSVGTAVRFDPGPYTAIEGYLQLVKPLSSQPLDPQASDSKSQSSQAQTSLSKTTEPK